MILDKRTVVNRVLSKERFYAHNAVSGALKKALVNDVDKMIITNKIAPETLNISAGVQFNEILVIHVMLKHDKINNRLFDALDRAIAAGYVLFIFECNNARCASIAYKTQSATGDITLGQRWTTEWASDVVLDMDGMSVDMIYNKLISQISGGRIQPNFDISLSEAVARDVERKKIEKQITDLRAKIDREPQLNRRLEFRDRVRELEQKLKEI